MPRGNYRNDISAVKTVQQYFLMTIGLAMYVVGWVVFLMPNHLVGGGVSGIAAIVQYATGLKMGYTYGAINIILLLISFKVLGFSFGWKTIYAICFASVMLNIMPGWMPEAFIQSFSVSNGKLICTILGGIMSGVGIGVAMSQGGSTGGTDIIALMVNKYRNVSPGRLLLAMDVVIILSVLVCPSYDAEGNAAGFADRLATAVYGFILVTVNSYTLDLYLSGSKQSVQAFIFSSKYQEIADAIAYQMKRGVTVIPAEGWFTKTDRQIVLVVIRKQDLNVLFRYVKQIDPDAFLSVSSVMGVYGKGFDTIKVSKLKKKDDIPTQE